MSNCATRGNDEENIMKQSSLLVTIALTAGLFSGPAWAAKRGINIAPNSFRVSGGADLGSSTVRLPDTNSAAAGFVFTLPPDYKAGTAVYLNMRLEAAAAVPCTAMLNLNVVRRTRVGKPYYWGLAGASLVNGGAVSFANSNVSASKTVKIVPAAATGLKGQKPGDGFFVQVNRQGQTPEDSCLSYMFLLGAEVRYTRK
jgi:hypothetical protein